MASPDERTRRRSRNVALNPADFDTAYKHILDKFRFGLTDGLLEIAAPAYEALLGRVTVEDFEKRQLLLPVVLQTNDNTCGEVEQVVLQTEITKNMQAFSTLYDFVFRFMGLARIRASNVSFFKGNTEICDAEIDQYLKNACPGGVLYFCQVPSTPRFDICYVAHAKQPGAKDLRTREIILASPYLKQGPRIMFIESGEDIGVMCCECVGAARDSGVAARTIAFVSHLRNNRQEYLRSHFDDIQAGDCLCEPEDEEFEALFTAERPLDGAQPPCYLF